MAIRASAMSRMDAPPALQEADSPFRKTLLLILLISASAFLLALFFKQQSALPLLLSTFFADASLGLIAGFGSRFVLQKQNLWIRSLVAMLLVIFGMMLIGYLTHWVLGIGPIIINNTVLAQ